MSKYKLNNFAFYPKLKSVEDLHKYEKRDARLCSPSTWRALSKIYSQQLNQIGFQDSFSKNTINCELKIFSNEWDFWKKFKIKPSVKERRMWVQLVSG